MDKETVEHIKENVKTILTDSFKNKDKQLVLEYEDRLNFACPYCGDSTDTRKRRGNIYLSNLTFHCFNCGHHCNYIKFMHDFDMSVESENLDIIAETIRHGKKKKKSTFDIDVFDRLDEIALTRKELKDGFYLSEIMNGKMYEYLKSRCLKNKTNWFMYNKYHNELWILNLTKNNKIAGVQIRSFDPDKVKYRTYNISKLYQYLKKEMPVTDEEELGILNQTGITFNITNIDLFDKIYVFEGPIDAMFLNNSVGIAGVGRNFDLIENLPETRYFFDNDKAGFKKTKEKLQEGKKVFMWKKLLDDLNIQENIKDFNDLIIYLVKNKIKFNFNEIENYFTDNELDLLEI